jgi:hypothetical protein
MSTEYEAQKVHAQRMRELRDAPDLVLQRAVALLFIAALALAPALLALAMQLAPFDM